MIAGVAAAVRRTQAERRESSRARILDATLECLAERGYAGTSFPEVLRRAGLSNGALWRHFRSKAELLAAAGLHSEQRLMASIESSGSIGQAVDRLWDYVHQPAVQALLELMFASRHDADLRSALKNADRDAGEIFFKALADMTGAKEVTDPSFRRGGRLLALMLYGTTLTSSLRTPSASRALRQELRELAEELLST